MSTAITVFRGDPALTVSIGVTTGSARVAVSFATTPSGPSSQEPSVRCVNIGSNPAFVEFGGSSVTATTTQSMVIASGTYQTVRIDNTQTNVAAICVTGTTSVYFTPGYGH